MKTPATAYAVPTEGTAITESGHIYGQTSLVPHVFGVFNQMSRLLLEQTAGVARDFVANDQARILSRVVDYQALLGSGVAGNCVGIANNGVSASFSGTSASLSTLENVVTSIGDAIDSSFGWCTNKAVASTLRQRQEIGTGSLTLWRGSTLRGTLIDYPAQSSSNISAGYLFAGAWRYLVIALWGGGLELQVSPYGVDGQQFQKGIIGIRTFLTMDAATIYPSAFQYATNVT
jgi:HK97 family phage major capsid protein